MKKINLRELYPDVYTTDFFVDVTEEVMEIIRAAERAEAAYERKMYRYKAQYSLDCENGIENAVLLKPQTPEQLDGFLFCFRLPGRIIFRFLDRTDMCRKK